MNRSILILSMFLFGFVLISCQSNETVGLIDIKLEVLDNEANNLDIQISGRYSTKQKGLTKKETEYVKNESDKIEFISKNIEKVTANHSASEIYSYERAQIEDEITKKLEDRYKNEGLKILDFYFVSVNMPDSLMNLLIERHKELKKK